MTTFPDSPRGPLAGLALSLLLAGAASAQDAAVPAPEDVLMVRLKTGAFQWASIEEHTEDALSFRRLDNGGLVTVPWSMVEPRQELELRTRFGYVDLTGEEIMLQAEQLSLADGREVVGLKQGETDDAILFLTQGRTLQIPKALVRSYVGGLLVPALDVKSKEDLYREQELALDLETAEGNWELARFCERILDFARAQEHYLAVAELDPDFKADEVAVILERIQVKVDNQEQVDFLAEVDLLMRRDKFGDALLQLTLFDTTYPDSELRTDRLELEERVLRSRDDFMRAEVPKAWFSWMGRLTAKAAREQGFEGALAYLEEGLHDEIVQNVTAGLKRHWAELEEDQVRQFFIERKKGRWKAASYSHGTWLLGEEDALKGNVEQAQAAPQSARDQAREDQAEKIQRWLRNQEMAKRARGSQEDEEEVELAWTLLSPSARRNWLIAYYAENGGDLEVKPKPELRDCTECGGRGVREVIFSGSARQDATSGVMQVACPTCHGIGRSRRIRFR
jgi:hypothetical protein